MTNTLKRIFATVLICTLMIGCSSHAAMNAEAKSVNKFTLRVGQKDTLRVTNCKKKTSLDKGTQRTTTENELPSLTQCTA